MNKWRALVLVLVVGGLGAWWAMGSRGQRPPMKPLPTQLDPAVLADVAAGYQRDVQPLFKRACFDCHTKDTVWPWYHAVPGVRQYIEGHVQEGREDLDLSDGFPFNTDIPVLRHLRRIGMQVKRGDMPLWDYKLMHPDARLTDSERDIIVRWAQDGFDRLTSTAKDAAGPLSPTAGAPNAGQAGKEGHEAGEEGGEHHHHHHHEE